MFSGTSRLPADLANTESGTLLLTVNNRLAQELHRRYDRQQAALGRRVWPTPDITPWSAWLRRSYEQLIDTGFTPRVLLNQHQERLLWERVVRNSREGKALLRPTAAARTAQQTWQLLNDWQLDTEQLLQQASEETRAFIGWQAHFREICERQQLISQAELGGLLLAAAQQGQLECPTNLQLAGFDAINPLQQALLDALQAQGSKVKILSAESRDSQRQRLELPDPQTEMRAAAHWAKQWIEQHPDAQVAIVSPRLEECRDELARICTQVINPQAMLPGQPRHNAFNLSLGQPLANYPLVAHLLIALRLMQRQDIPLDEIGTLLRSPFIGGHASEWDRRAMLDFVLRDDGLPQIDLFRLIHRAEHCDELSRAHAPQLIERLQQLQAKLEQLPEDDTPNAWAGHLLSIIEALGWPGDLPPDSSEFQQAAKLRDTISTFSTLSRVHRRMRLPEVLRRLRELCEETVFQPQSDAAAIQVLGTLEAAGMQFDAIWLLGFDDRSWPPSPSPNPLLPTQLQRELGMPHASAERELQFARHLLEQLYASAPQVFVSHAAKDGDREQRPSPLCSALPLIDAEQLALPDQDALHSAALQAGQCDDLPPIESVPPNGSPKGGSWLLSDQSACPFRAVGRHRLKATPLPEASAAPSPMLLGQIIHDVLKRVWDQIQTAEQLRALDNAALLALIEPQASESLADFGRRRPDVFTQAFTALEVQRLCELLLDWLNLEKQRGKPFRVLRLEERQQVTLNGLSLRLQADRVDQLDDGRLVIIDYKTGEKSDARGWFDPRPTDLQVPLYCVQAEQAPAAALIGRVHSRSTLFRGTVQEEKIVPGIKPFEGDEELADWQALLDHWRSALNALADEVLAGRAQIAPQDANTCSFCELGPLCRISSLREGVVADDDGMELVDD